MRLMPLLVALTFFASCLAADPDRDVRGTTLREIIEEQIRANVRESYGEFAGQNFSWEDLKRFNRDKVPAQIVDVLRKSAHFRAAVEKVRAMPADDREACLKRCRLPLRKTWAELGKISRRGTTDVGREAELEISNAIVDLAEEILKGAPETAPSAKS